MNKFEYTLKPYTPDDYEFVYNTKKVAYEKYVILNWGTWNEEQQKQMFVDFIATYGNNIKIVIEQGKRIGFYHGEELENGAYELGNICIIQNIKVEELELKF